MDDAKRWIDAILVVFYLQVVVALTRNCEVVQSLPFSSIIEVVVAYLMRRFVVPKRRRRHQLVYPHDIFCHIGCQDGDVGLPVVLRPICYLNKVLTKRRQGCGRGHAQVARTSPSSTTSSCDAAQGGKLDILQVGRSIWRTHRKKPSIIGSQLALVSYVPRLQLCVVPKLRCVGVRPDNFSIHHR